MFRSRRDDTKIRRGDRDVDRKNKKRERIEKEREKKYLYSYRICTYIRTHRTRAHCRKVKLDIRTP